VIYKERLKELRESEAMSQTEIANIINKSNKTYQHYETEYAIIPIKHLNNICNYFNISLDYIFNFTDNKQYDNNNKEIISKLSGIRLRELRKENNITQEKLSDTLKVLRQTLSNYEKGKSLIATPFLYTICKKYNISADYLLGKTDNPKHLK